jgi:hypothetical protein
MAYTSSGLILPKTTWIKTRSAIDAFYNSVSIEEVEALNATLRAEKKIAKRPIEAGHIYLLLSSNGYYKIGWARNVTVRIGQHLRDYPIELTCIHAVSCANALASERYLLSKFSEKKKQGEWFSLDEVDVIWFTSLDEQSLAFLVREWMKSQ